LQLGNPCLKPSGQALIAGLLVAFVLLLDAMAACPGLHEWLHADADKAGHECAVTMFIHGQVDSAVVLVAAVLPPSPVACSPLTASVQFHSRTDTLPPGRGPPSDSVLA
jgi:hypothetical protein